MKGKNIKDRRDRVKELYNKEKSGKEIAQELGVSRNTIVNDIAYLKEQGEITGEPQLQKIIQRRKKVKKLYSKEKTQEGIAQELGVSQATISSDIAYLEKQGEITGEPQLQKIIQRRKKVKELYNKEKSKKEIAQELGVSRNTIVNDIAYLKEQGEIAGKPQLQKIIQRRKKVKELYKEGKSQEEIAQELGVSRNTIVNDIAYLKEQGEITGKPQLQKIIQRRKKVKELYSKEKTQEGIAQELGVSQATISSDIAYLEKQGEITGEPQKIIQRRKKVKELYNKEKSKKEIAQELGVSRNTIVNDIAYLKEQGEIAGKPQPQERRKKVKELYNKEKSGKEIAQELGVSQATISSDIAYLEKQGEITGKAEKTQLPKILQRREVKEQETVLTEAKIEKLCKDFCGQRSSEKQFERYILQCKNRFTQGILKKEEIPTIEKVARLTEKYQDIAFYLKVSIRFGQFRQATIFANNQMNNQALTEEEKGKIRKLREEIQELNKKYIAMKELKRGGGVQQAVKYSGLPETEVISLNRKLLQKAQESKKKKEENDDGEEPKK